MTSPTDAITTYGTLGWEMWNMGGNLETFGYRINERYTVTVCDAAEEDGVFPPEHDTTPINVHLYDEMAGDVIDTRHDVVGAQAATEVANAWTVQYGTNA